jgi:hypothetical protein
MSVAFKPGQTLTQDDLKITVRSNLGVPVDPAYIRYSLFDDTTGLEVLIGAPDRIPATSGTGQFYVGATMPLDSNIGDWLVRWNIRETSTAPMVQVVQAFNIVKESVTTSVTGNVLTDALVRRLRIILRDNNPDRNYSVSGSEFVTIHYGSKQTSLSLRELWEIVEEGRHGDL